jgi:hypothetical protein
MGISLSSMNDTNIALSFSGTKETGEKNYFIGKLVDSSDGMSDKNKEKMNARIYAKLKSGKKLTSKEEQYLQSTNPQMYVQYQRIRTMDECMENRLKHARSKEEANEIITSTISNVSDKDPYKQYMVAALNETAKDFRNSKAYAKLPNTKDDANKRNSSRQTSEGQGFSDDSDDSDLMSWSPLQEIIDALPTFNKTT